MAASPGKDEIVMKKKLSVGLIIAILVSLAAIAFAATEYVQKFISVNWQGETAADQNAAIDVPDPLSNPMNRMRKILNSTPDDVLPIIEWNGTPPRSSRVRRKKTDSLKGIDYNTGIVLPDNIAEKDSFSVDLTYGCLAEGEYTLISEEKVDEFTLKQYTVDPAYDVVIGYSIQFKDKNRDLYHDDNQYWHTIRSELSISEDNSFQFAVIDGEEHSAQSVEIPGMDKAVFINLGMNTRLIAIRMLNKPVVVKTKPGEQLLGETTEFQYERIQLEGFTLEECMAFFSQE
jgi:flagellar basal body-associated protein FliL